MVNQDFGILMLFLKPLFLVIAFIFALIGLIMKRIDKIQVQQSVLQAEHNIGYPKCLECGKCLNFEVKK